MMKGYIVGLLALIFIGVAAISFSGFTPSTSNAETVNKDFNFITASELSSQLLSKTPVNLVDIQVEAEFKQHHIDGAIATYAYPVKTEEDCSKLSGAIHLIKQNSDPIVIVCPRGGGGAKRTYNYLLSQGIPAERLTILEKGQQGWPGNSQS